MKGGGGEAQQLPLAGRKVPCLQAGKALKHQGVLAFQALNAKAFDLCQKFQNFHLVPFYI